MNDLADFERNIRMVRPYWAVIDTITNTGDFKSQTTDDAKRQYEPLQKIALKCQVPIFCVTHTNAQGKTLGRRANEKVRVAIMLLHPDKGQPHRRKLWVDKSKAVKPPALGVTMGDKGNEYDFNPPEEVKEEAYHGGGDKKPTKVAECLKWLEDLLGSGSHAVTELIDLCEEAGFNKAALYRAREKMDINEYEVGNRKHWQLNFPD